MTVKTTWPFWLSLYPPHNSTPPTCLYNHSAYIYNIDLITDNTQALCHALSILRGERLFQDQHTMTLPVTSFVSNHNKQSRPVLFYHDPLDNTQALYDHHACLILRSKFFFNGYKIKNNTQWPFRLHPSFPMIMTIEPNPIHVFLWKQHTALTAIEDNTDTICNLRFERLISTEKNGTKSSCSNSKQLWGASSFVEHQWHQSYFNFKEDKKIQKPQYVRRSNTYGNDQAVYQHT